MHVCVWKYGREVRGWDGKEETFDKVLKFPVVDIATALYSVYKTDAHFCPAVMYDAFGNPVSAQPRLKIESIEEIRKIGMDVKFTIIAIDVDAPNKEATDEWRAAEKEKVNASGVCSNAIIYYTSGGYRLLWSIPPTSIEQYEELLSRLRQTLERDGIVADRLIDWSRCYRLPKVTKGGIIQDLYLLVPPSFVLNQTILVETKKKEDKTFLDTIAEAATSNLSSIEEVKSGGRNNYLFKVAAKIRGSGWIPESMYLPLLMAINQERCNPPLSDSEVKVICNSATKYPKGGDEIEATPKSKVVLRVGDLSEIVNSTLEILAEVLDNSLYQRDGKIVRLLDDRIEEIPKAALRKLIADYVQFVKYTKEGEEVPQDPPKDIVDIIYETGSFPQLRELHELLFLPSVTPEGQIISDEGYNAELKAYIKPSVEIGKITPSREEAEKALARLRSMIDEFPFQKDEHFAVAMAAIMTPVLRTAITGPTPMFIFDSTTPGTGKSKLADIASLIATGREAPRMVQTKEEEMEKRITAILLSGARTCLVDNIDKPLGGASLDALMTGDTWMGRILGRTEMRQIIIRTTMYATGNNIVLAGDMTRRCLRCFMDPNTEKPEERTFRISSHKEYIEENKEQIVRDIITIAMAYMQAEPVKIKTFGSFESWSRWVREPLIWLGLKDPVATQVELKEDSPIVNWGIILEALNKIFGDQWFSVKDLYDVSFEGVRRNAEHDAYNALSANMSYFAEPNIKQLSWALKKWLGRIINGKRLVRADTKDRLKGFMFRIEAAECEARVETKQEAA